VDIDQVSVYSPIGSSIRFLTTTRPSPRTTLLEVARNNKIAKQESMQTSSRYTGHSPAVLISYSTTKLGLQE
jgi:hypothetical protein